MVYKYTVQSGRSMVEMLGVLVIMGVLSIGGIMGYSYAINKYRANSLLNDIRMRQVDLMAQYLSGQKVNFQAWKLDETSIYSFVDPMVDDEGVISLSVLNVEEAVCKIVFDELKSKMVSIDINSSSGKTSDDCAPSNTMTFSFAESMDNVDCETSICFNDSEKPIMYYCLDDSECGTCQFCNEEGTCQFLEEGVSCGQGQGMCLAGDCVYQECQSNSDCSANEFCSGSDRMNCEQLPFRCKKIDFSKIKLKFADQHIETWFVSHTQLSYWDAKNACGKLGKKMVSVNELVDNYPSEMILPRTERLILLDNKLGSVNFWTSEEYNSCYSISVFSREGYTVNMINTTKGRRFALCR